MERLTSQGKHTLKVRNHLHTNMISNYDTGEDKCRLLALHLVFKDQQVKTVLFIYRLLYPKPSGNCKLESYGRYTHTHTKESKHNTESQSSNQREGNKRKEEKRPTKTNPKQLTKWQEEHTY